jgi:chromosome segregation ATPase
MDVNELKAKLKTSVDEFNELEQALRQTTENVKTLETALEQKRGAVLMLNELVKSYSESNGEVDAEVVTGDVVEDAAKGTVK